MTTRKGWFGGVALKNSQRKYMIQRLNTIMGLLIVVGCLNVMGCATLIKGRGQSITIESEPSGAQVYAEEQLLGETPMQHEFAHGKPVDLVLKKTNYEDAYRRLTVSFSGHSLWLGIWSLLYDVYTGAFLTHDLEKVRVQLHPRPAHEQIQPSDNQEMFF